MRVTGVGLQRSSEPGEHTHPCIVCGALVRCFNDRESTDPQTGGASTDCPVERGEEPEPTCEACELGDTPCRNCDGEGAFGHYESSTYYETPCADCGGSGIEGGRR